MINKGSDSTDKNSDTLDILEKIDQNLKLGNLNQALEKILQLDSLLSRENPGGIQAFKETSKVIKEVGSHQSIINLLKTRKNFNNPKDKKRQKDNERLEILLGIK